MTILNFIWEKEVYDLKVVFQKKNIISYTKSLQRQTYRYVANHVKYSVLWQIQYLSQFKSFLQKGCTQKNGSDMYMHASAVHINVHAHFAIL